MSYTALYRKWRPLTFEEVVGQEAITRTLLNQIASDRVAHAYLFNGTRGTGKTTTAKIFSRAVNCTAAEGPLPCNQCANCRSILDETNMDVFEMDAASNNGVDDIRELREHVKYPPSSGRYKVYIIDEVHMLSKGAFNALLKTLEEPPAHILFILATTEPHKIPATIHSRCQRFDFKRVPYDAVTKVLADVCQKEGRDCEPEALKLIVQASDGAMRDALSILDRCLSFEEGALTHGSVLSVLGLSGDRYLTDLVRTLLDKDPDAMLQAVHQAVTEGKDLGQMIRELVEFCRKLLLVHVARNPEHLLDVSKEMQQTLLELAKDAGTPRLMEWLSQFSKLEAEAKWTHHPRALLEMTLVRLLHPAATGAPDELAARVEALERRLAEGHRGFTEAPALPRKEPQPSVAAPPVRTAPSPPAPPSAADVRPKPVRTESAGPGSMEVFREKWPAVLAALKKSRISTYALMVEGELQSFEAPVLTVAFGEQFGFHRMAMEKEENRQLVEQIIEQQTGCRVRLSCAQKGSQTAVSTKSPDWVEDVKDFFKGYEDKLVIDPTKED